MMSIYCPYIPPPPYLFSYFDKPIAAVCKDLYIDTNNTIEPATMNTFSEKQPDGPLLPVTNPITQDASTTSARSCTDKFLATVDAFTCKLEKCNRAFYSISAFLMIATQILCLGTVLAFTAWLAYLFTTGRRVK